MMTNNDTFNKYKCPSAANEGQMSYYLGNCSDVFLADTQWGQSKVTMDPPYADAAYFPTFDLPNNHTGCLTVANWTMPGIGSQAPEYAYYVQFVYNPFPGTLAAPILDAD